MLLKCYQRLLLSSFIFACGSNTLAAEIKPQIIKYRPLEIFIPIHDIHTQIDRELKKLEREEFKEKSVKFRFYDVRSVFDSNGRILVKSNIRAKTKVPIKGSFSAKARAKLWISVEVEDWNRKIVPVDSQISFSNDIFDLAFSLVRGRIEDRIINLAKDSLRDLDDKILRDPNFTLQNIQKNGRLDAILQADGIKFTLTQR